MRFAKRAARLSVLVLRALVELCGPVGFDPTTFGLEVRYPNWFVKSPAALTGCGMRSRVDQQIGTRLNFPKQTPARVDS